MAGIRKYMMEKLGGTHAERMAGVSGALPLADCCTTECADAHHRTGIRPE